MTLAIALEPAPIKADAQGVVRVAETRVTLDTVVIAFLEGCTPEEIGEQYPSLQLSDIYLVMATTSGTGTRFMPTKTCKSLLRDCLHYPICYSPSRQLMLSTTLQAAKAARWWLP
ncbi:hypothetical protein XM38_039550 [Halomicronema hongdechloris C2206]|uniref:DUF433 domain-containing protein n=1 Tax=Halomicronema hongdechloris C2206 TaxID=1641165 RepID=A0A1Z3HRP4_9CYAN|nr:DUF433 domain-containing protein [Halomicronema hongdechloris]ASC72994.1 hypothetical protein XM38_039550 [Halomicronema hongdechloris C2206]